MGLFLAHRYNSHPFVFYTFFQINERPMIPRTLRVSPSICAHIQTPNFIVNAFRKKVHCLGEHKIIIGTTFGTTFYPKHFNKKG